MSKAYRHFLWLFFVRLSAMATGSSQALLRTQAPSLIGSLYLATPFSAFVPQGPAKSKAHMREYISQIPRTGNAVTGGQPRFEIQRDVDVITMGIFRFTLAAIPVANWGAGATFSRYVDMVGLAAMPQIVVRSGTQQLQLVKPLESLIAILKLSSNEHRRNILRLIGAGTPAERSAKCLADQEITVPFLTTLGLNLHGDMSQSLYVRGLNDFLTFEVQLAAASEIIESDAVLPSFPTTGAQPIVPNSLELLTEGFHLTKRERAMIATYYKDHAFSIHFKDQQYSTAILPGGVGNGAKALPFTSSDLISNINQPVQALFLVVRWVSDLNRRCGDAGGTRGRNIFNIAGWCK